MANWLEVVWIDTRRNTTKMVKLQALWDRPVMALPEGSVGVDLSSLDGCSAVAAGVLGALPDPAAVLVFDVFNWRLAAVMSMDVGKWLAFDMPPIVERFGGQERSLAATTLAVAMRDLLHGASLYTT